MKKIRKKSKGKSNGKSQSASKDVEAPLGKCVNKNGKKRTAGACADGPSPKRAKLEYPCTKQVSGDTSGSSPFPGDEIVAGVGEEPHADDLFGCFCKMPDLKDDERVWRSCRRDATWSHGSCMRNLGADVAYCDLCDRYEERDDAGKEGLSVMFANKCVQRVEELLQGLQEDMADDNLCPAVLLNSIRDRRAGLHDLNGRALLYLGDNGVGKSCIINSHLLVTTIPDVCYKRQARSSDRPSWWALVQAENEEMSNDDIDRIHQVELEMVNGGRFEKDSNDFQKVTESLRKVAVSGCTQLSPHYLLPSGNSTRVTTGHATHIHYGERFAVMVEFHDEEQLYNTASEFVKAKLENKTNIDEGVKKRYHSLSANPDKTARRPMEQEKRARGAILSDSVKRACAERFRVFSGAGKDIETDRQYCRYMLDAINVTQNVDTKEWESLKGAIKKVTVFVPSLMLFGGGSIIDPPGLNDSDPLHIAALEDAIGTADTIVCVLPKTLSSVDTIKKFLTKSTSANNSLVHTLLESQKPNWPGKARHLVFMHYRERTPGHAFHNDLQTHKREDASMNQETTKDVKEMLLDELEDNESLRLLDPGASEDAVERANNEFVEKCMQKSVTVTTAYPILFASLLLATFDNEDAPEQDKKALKEKLALSNGHECIGLIDWLGQRACLDIFRGTADDLLKAKDAVDEGHGFSLASSELVQQTCKIFGSGHKSSQAICEFMRGKLEWESASTRELIKGSVVLIKDWKNQMKQIAMDFLDDATRVWKVDIEQKKQRLIDGNLTQAQVADMLNEVTGGRSKEHSLLRELRSHLTVHDFKRLQEDLKGPADQFTEDLCRLLADRTYEAFRHEQSKDLKEEIDNYYMTSGKELMTKEVDKVLFINNCQMNPGKPENLLWEFNRLFGDAVKHELNRVHKRGNPGVEMLDVQEIVNETDKKFRLKMRDFFNKTPIRRLSIPLQCNQRAHLSAVLALFFEFCQKIQTGESSEQAIIAFREKCDEGHWRAYRLEELLKRRSQQLRAIGEDLVEGMRMKIFLDGSGKDVPFKLFSPMPVKDLSKYKSVKQTGLVEFGGPTSLANALARAFYHYQLDQESANQREQKINEIIAYFKKNILKLYLYDQAEAKQDQLAMNIDVNDLLVDDLSESRKYLEKLAKFMKCTILILGGEKPILIRRSGAKRFCALSTSGGTYQPLRPPPSGKANVLWPTIALIIDPLTFDRDPDDPQGRCNLTDPKTFARIRALNEERFRRLRCAQDCMTVYIPRASVSENPTLHEVDKRWGGLVRFADHDEAYCQGYTQKRDKDIATMFAVAASNYAHAPSFFLLSHDRRCCQLLEQLREKYGFKKKVRIKQWNPSQSPKDLAALIDPDVHVSRKDVLKFLHELGKTN